VNAAVVSGARRDLHHFIYPRFSSHENAGIPVVSGGLRGGFVNIVSLNPGDPSLTRIEGSIQVHGQTRLHGSAVTPDLAIQNLLAPLREQRAGERKEILAHFSEKLSLNPQAESSLTDFIADVIKEQTHADIVISPLGVVTRAPVPEIAAGDFSRADLNALFPLPVPIVTLEVKGEELKTLLQLSEMGLRGFSSVSGVKLRLLNPEEEAPKLPSGIRNRLLSTDEPEIESKETYHLAVPLALVQGADDWHLARRIKVTTSNDQAQDLKQIVASWLSQQKAGSKIGVPVSRLTFVKGKAAAKGHGKRRARAHSKSKRRSQAAKT
jgi:2',3'-cyclic-nucleotide 2'-phosphodiesterase (5'-nucleotidase family)